MPSGASRQVELLADYQSTDLKKNVNLNQTKLQGDIYSREIKNLPLGT